MSGLTTCEIVGRWRIVAADTWDRAYLDLSGSAHLTIGGDGRAEFAFGALQASGEIEYARTMVFFRWEGFDEGDEIAGEASAELQDNGSLEIDLSFNNGDDATLTAPRERLVQRPASGVIDSEHREGAWRNLAATHNGYWRTPRSAQTGRFFPGRTVLGAVKVD